MHLLTFDIEDWFHTHQNRQTISGSIWTGLPPRVEENTARILALLDEFNVKATFFILGWVAEHHPGLVNLIKSKGHDIGSHSYWHHHANRLNKNDFEKDLVKSISAISNITGEQVIAHRAPAFSLKSNHHWVFEIMASHGITIDSSVKLSTYSGQPYTINTEAGKIVEFPLIRSRFGLPYSGGGYFRVMPDFLFNKLFIEGYNSVDNNQYLLMYFHPRDFDEDNPYSNIFTLFRNFLNSYNTNICMNRLRAVIPKMNFITISEAAKIINQ